MLSDSLGRITMKSINSTPGGTSPDKKKEPSEEKKDNLKTQSRPVVKNGTSKSLAMEEDETNVLLLSPPSSLYKENNRASVLTLKREPIFRCCGAAISQTSSN